MINTVHYEESEIKDNPHGVDVRQLFDSEHIQVIEIRLMPGEGLKRHATPVDVCFYILEGSGTVEIGGESARVSADTLVESPKGIPHRLMNEGDGPFRFLVLKTPKPTSQTRLL